MENRKSNLLLQSVNQIYEKYEKTHIHICKHGDEFIIVWGTQ